MQANEKIFSSQDVVASLNSLRGYEKKSRGVSFQLAKLRQAGSLSHVFRWSKAS
jgi:hypothetical protein